MLLRFKDGRETLSEEEDGFLLIVKGFLPPEQTLDRVQPVS